MKYLKGSCLCGKVRLEVFDQFLYAGHCHCSQCRKYSGSAFSSLAGVDGNDFRVVEGEEWIAYYHKTQETDLAFCRNCGSSLFSRKIKTGRVNVRLGILDDVPQQKPAFHVFTGSKAPWYEISDDLPQFDERPGISLGSVTSP